MNTKNGNKPAKRGLVQLLLIIALLAYPLLQGPTNFAASTARTLPSLNRAEYAMTDTSSVAQNYQPADIKVLAEGFHSKVTKPFVAVVRDAETYAALTKLDENLPGLDADFFKENVAVAAFLGERNTGGYGIEITRQADGRIVIAEKAPGKGVMVPQMITSPFKIAAVERAYRFPVLLTLDATWRQRMRSYWSIGKFTQSGGFVGMTEQISIGGEVRVMREAKLASIAFELYSPESKHPHSLIEFATGVVKGDDQVNITKMSADSLVNLPNSGLQAIATFAADDQKFSVSFMSLPSNIADGYSGMGTIEAKIVVSPPKP